MSLRKHILNLHLRLFEKPHLARTKDPARLRASFERKAKLFFRAPRGSRFEEATLTHDGESIPALMVRPPGADGQNRPVILYFHGGGYVFGSPRSYGAMLARLSKLSGLSACLPDYRLAPEQVFPAAVEDALTSYRALINHPGGMVIGGDSAGGGLVLALLAEILRHGLPKPLGTFAFSPLTDLTFSGASFVANAKSDVVLPAQGAHDMADMYLSGADPRDPRASPLCADFTGAPPVWLAVGDREFLLDDTVRIGAAMKEQGVDIAISKASNLPHVWTLFQGFLPEADQTLADLAQWVTALSPRSDGS